MTNQIPASAVVEFNGAFCGTFGEQDQSFKDQFAGMNPEFYVGGDETGDVKMARITIVDDVQVFANDTTYSDAYKIAESAKERLIITWEA